MGDLELNSDDLRFGDNSESSDPCLECAITLIKDLKPICRTRCLNPPFKMPYDCNISCIFRPKSGDRGRGLSQCILLPDAKDTHQQQEWDKFMKFLMTHKRVAHAKVGSCNFYISPPRENCNFGQAIMKYEVGNKEEVDKEYRHDCAGVAINSPNGNSQGVNLSYSRQVEDTNSANAKASSMRPSGLLQSNSTQTHPSYLRTLGQSHSGWIFGAIAELVDNAGDAKATKLEVFVEMVFSKSSGENIPMLSVIDDGHGMNHHDIMRMISFGHEQPDEADPRRIGRYGIGFKSGAMRLGKDALVLTQTASSRSIAFLSQSFNEGKNSLEIPIVSYQRKGRHMDVDTLVQTADLAKCNLKAIKKFSPFNEYLIGEKAGLFHENGTGTQIYIWNLDKWGSDYCLEWENEKRDGSYFHKSDIFIRSRRVRTRPGQTSRTVPLDYSLQSYLEVMFLEPRMKIYVQGVQVKCRPLAKSLTRTVVENGCIAGKTVELTMGQSQLEWEHANCGIFLYWHGRLIEAYKRVGMMVHSADTGRGVIGVMDVTDIMDKTSGESSVLNNKQGFQDCELYAQLEDWMGKKFNQYWDTNFDSLQVGKGSAINKPDNEWVQCDKCRKWRMLSPGFDCRQLPLEWFCYMDPFHGHCENPEQKVEPGVITVSTKRDGYNTIHNRSKSQEGCSKKSSSLLGECEDDDDNLAVKGVGEEIKPVLKRRRRGIH